MENCLLVTRSSNQMNTRKIFRKIGRGDRDFTPSSAKSVRIAIAESLVLFFEQLKQLPDTNEKEQPNECETTQENLKNPRGT